MKIKIKEEDQIIFSEILLITQLIIQLECKITFRNLNGQEISIKNNKYKIIKWNEAEQIATLRNNKGERSENEISFELLNNNDNFPFSELIHYIKTIELKDKIITVKEVLKTLKTPLTLTKGQKKLNDKFNWNI